MKTLLQWAVYGMYAPPKIRAKIDLRQALPRFTPRGLIDSPKLQINCRGKDARKGRTNGLPWDGTSPISASTEINAKKVKPDPKAGLGAWQKVMGLRK